MASLEAGKAVFSEKPIAEAPSGTARCYAKAEEVGKPLFCAFNRSQLQLSLNKCSLMNIRRFDPSFKSVKAKVRAGELGHVHMIKTTSRDSPLPSINYLKISGGIFHDCAVHDIDMVTWILGEYPSKVTLMLIPSKSKPFCFLYVGLLKRHQPHPRDCSNQ